MMKKKFMAIMLVAAMAVSMVACGSKQTDKNVMKNGEQTTDNSTTDNSTTSGEGTLKISWWGGDTRHEATAAAIKKFEETTNIKVGTEFGAWTGWEDKMATSFYSKTAPDVNQINWNWIESFSSDGSAFLDLNTVSDQIDLTQFDESALALCEASGKLQAIPVAMTGRIFYWNKTTFEKAGISTPTTLAELMTAGETFKTKLGDDYYPLALNEYDRMILMVYYLESVYGKAWVEDNKLQYTQEEIQKGLEFIQSLEDAHVIPSMQTMLGDGAESVDKNPKWMDGRYAGIFEWDSAASKFKAAMNEGQEFVVGDYFADMGQYKGGFSKVSLAFAISENTKYPKESAQLINFLLNEEAGVELMSSERGVPLSKKGLEICKAKGMLDETVAEANAKVLAWVDYPLDPKFEDASLKSTDGVYYDVMSGLSYKEYDAKKAAEILISGIESVLAG